MRGFKMSLADSCFRKRARSASWHGGFFPEGERLLSEETGRSDRRREAAVFSSRHVFKYTRCSDDGFFPSSDGEGCCGESLASSPSDSEEFAPSQALGRKRTRVHPRTDSGEPAEEALGFWLPVESKAFSAHASSLCEGRHFYHAPVHASSPASPLKAKLAGFRRGEARKDLDRAGRRPLGLSLDDFHHSLSRNSGPGEEATAPGRSLSASGWLCFESHSQTRQANSLSRAAPFGEGRSDTSNLETQLKTKEATETPRDGAGTFGVKRRTCAHGNRRLQSCNVESCCTSCGYTRLNMRGPVVSSSPGFDSLKREVATLGVNWGDPMSFWFVETARDEVVAREFQRLFRLNSSEAALAVHSFRLFVTIMVIVSAIKYGIMTYFPPENYVAFTSFFCADVVLWIFFVGDALLRSRSLGPTRFWRDRQSCYDLFLLAVGLGALVLRVCILIDVCGLGERVFSPDKLARTDGIVNAFTVGDVQTALLALDTIQLTRVYRLAFSCRELFFLTRSILHSLKSLQWTALFVVVIIYSCAVFCTWAYHDEDDAEMRLLWGNLMLSMFTLFTVLTLEGWNSVANSTAEKHPYSRIFFVLYICFTTLTLLNIVTGIILDAYVDMSSRLSKEATYQENLEKDSRNEKVLMAAFEKTCFLVCLRPPAPCSSSEGFHTCHSDAFSEPHQCASPSSAWEAAGCPHGTGCWVGAACRASQETAQLRPVEEERDICGGCSARRAQPFPSINWNCGAGYSAAVGVKSTLLERKATGGLSEDSTAKSATESDPSSHPRSPPEVVVQTGPVVAPLQKCIRYLRVAGHQPVDILRHPLVQEALQATRIPFYQAFDVLNMYHLRGIQYVTVKEFAEACSRVGGVATGRQLLLAQLELQQKLCAVDRRVKWLCRQQQQRGSLCASASLKAHPTLYETPRWSAS